MLRQCKWIAALLLFELLVLAPVVYAAQSSLRIPFDLDNDSNTGCTVAFSDPSSPDFEGAEITLEVRVDAFPDPPVTQAPQLVGCPPLTGSPEVSDLVGGVNLAKDAGYKGSDSLLVQIPMESLNWVSGTVRMAVEAGTPSGSHDVLLSGPGGEPLSFIAVGPGVLVPGLGLVGLLLLVGALLFVGTRGAARRAVVLMILGLSFLLTSGGLRVLASPTSEGWLDLFSGTGPLATDELGDSKFGDPAADITAVWVSEYNDELLVSIGALALSSWRRLRRPGLRRRV